MEKYLGQLVDVVIDRPLGSKHPRYNFIYSLNYGYLPNTCAPDNDEIDAYILGEFEPIEKFTGYVIAIIKRINDVEDKLVVAKSLNKYNIDAIFALTEFVERSFSYWIIYHDKSSKKFNANSNG